MPLPGRGCAGVGDAEPSAGRCGAGAVPAAVCRPCFLRYLFFFFLIYFSFFKMFFSSFFLSFFLFFLNFPSFSLSGKYLRTHLKLKLSLERPAQALCFVSDYLFNRCCSVPPKREGAGRTSPRGDTSDVFTPPARLTHLLSGAEACGHRRGRVALP